MVINILIDINSLEWETWISGFKVISGQWIVNNSTSQNQNSTEIKESFKSEAQILSTVSISIFGITSGVVVFMSFVNSSSMASLWSMVNQLQLYLLLTLTHSYLPKEIQLVIKGFKFSVNIYEYIPFRKSEKFPSIFEGFNFELTNPLLDSFGVNSDSTIFNIFPIMYSLILIILIHLCFFLSKILLSRWNDFRNCFINFIIKLFVTIYNSLTFGFYIRNSMEMTQLVLISATYELYKANTSSNLRIASLIVSISMILLYLAFCLFSLYLSISSYKVVETCHNKLGEFYTGIKMQNRFKIYTTILLIRRGLYVSLLILLESVNSKILIGFISFIQFAYVIYLFLLRPFIEKKWSIIEIINEIYFFLLLSSLIFLNKESDWNQALILIYIWVIVSNNIVIAFIVIGKLNLIIILLNR